MQDRRVIAITGATGGLGRAIAWRFAKAGSRIVVHYHRNKEAAEKLTSALEALGAEAILFGADVRSPAEMNSMTEATLNLWGRLDVLVANAAVRRDGLLARTTEEAWDAVLETNLTGVRNSLKAVGDCLIRQQEGRVIAIGSVAGVQGRAGQANYAASKAGLTGLIRSVAMEWGPHNIQLNVVFPGIQPTGMTATLSDKQRRTLDRQNLLGHAPPIDETAEFVYRLSRMTGVSGQIFNLDSRII
ncbi:MAG: SDR family NAD(P)-dependent oxidoreductase [Nitrospirae bacterium]|nr:SDR family NAD(P)-dependent oxidoreductase [Nitrospirota bacterium]